ncbi:MAG: PTS sugar transporter subunit IIA [Chromatiales bacterium]|jgi:PTS system ascorbate-specific IIA component
MSVGLLIVTHDQIGELLLRTAKRMLGEMPLTAHALSVTVDANPEVLLTQAHTLVDQINSGDGVLVLTDMYGSTPSNIAFGLMHPGSVHVISGINLPMLIRTLNYATLDLTALTEKAISGGKEGIFCCTQTEHA